MNIIKKSFLLFKNLDFLLLWPMRSISNGISVSRACPQKFSFCLIFFFNQKVIMYTASLGSNVPQNAALHRNLQTKYLVQEARETSKKKSKIEFRFASSSFSRNIFALEWVVQLDSISIK